MSSQMAKSGVDRRLRIAMIKLVQSFPDDVDAIFTELTDAGAYRPANGSSKLEIALASYPSTDDKLRRLSDKHVLIKGELRNLFHGTSPDGDKLGCFSEVESAFEREYTTCVSAIHGIDFAKWEKQGGSTVPQRAYLTSDVEQSRRILRMAAEQIVLLFPIDEQLSARATTPESAIYLDGNATHVDTQYVTKSISIGDGNTISAPIVVAETIQNSFAMLAGREMGADLKMLMKTLLEQIADAAKVVPSEESKDLADNAETLAKELARSKPRRPWYELSVAGLVEAAKAVGEVGAPIIETTTKLIPALVALWP